MEHQALVENARNGPLTASRKGTYDFTFVVDSLFRQWRYIGIVSTIILGLVVLALIAVPASYEATSRVVVDPPGWEVFSMQPGPRGASEPEYFETQTQVLKSSEVGIGVVRKLGLDRDSVVMKRDAIERVLQTAGIAALVGRISPDVRASAVGSSGDIPVKEKQALEYLSKHVSVTPLKNSRVIAVIVRTTDPVLSAWIANSLVDRLIETNIEAQDSAVKRSSRWLADELGKMRLKADESRKLLSRYRKHNGIVEIDDRQNGVSAREAELIREWSQVQADKIQRQALLTEAGLFGVSSLPQYRDSVETQQLVTKTSEISELLAQAQARYGDRHPEIVRLKSELAEVKRLTSEHEAQVLKELQSDYRAADAREKAITAELNQLKAALIGASEYGFLRREAQADEELYNSLHARVREVVLSAGSKSGNIRVIDKAIVPTRPSWPNMLLVVPIGLLAALLGGAAAGVVRETIDGSVRSRDAATLVNDSTHVVLLPAIRQGIRRKYEKSVGKVMSNRPRLSRAEIARFMLEQPGSAAAESMRTLMGVILLAGSNNKAKVVLVASPFPGEGKTTVAYNLALGLAEKGRTCFVDADLRKPGNQSKNSIFAHYRNAATENEIETASGDSLNLTCVESGSGSENPVSILVSERFESLASAIRARYEFVVIDSPPLLPYADARFLAALADGVVLVGYEGVTNRKAMESAVAILNQLSVPILGVVLNGARAADIPYGYCC